MMEKFEMEVWFQKGFKKKFKEFPQKNLKKDLKVEWPIKCSKYRKDTEHLYHAFMYSIVILLSGIYPFYAMLSLLVTIICYPFICTHLNTSFQCLFIPCNAVFACYNYIFLYYVEGAT